MKNLLTFLVSMSVFFLGGVFASIPFDSIGQILTYEHDPIFDTYIPVSAGSAVIDGDTILTNAHVVLNEYGELYEYLEFCMTQDTKKKPVCGYFPTLQIIDVDNDLALLTLNETLGTSELQLDSDVEIGELISLVGYPSNGGETITLTQGKVSGFDGGLYKIDASIDFGNSGGGAFDGEGNLIGIPSFAIDGLSALGYIIPIDTVLSFVSRLTTHSVVDVPVSPDFVAYRNSILAVGNTGSISDDGIQVTGVKNYGFQLMAGATSGLFDASSYIFVDKDQKSYVSLQKILQTNDVLERTRLLKLTNIIQDEYDLVLSKEITIGGIPRYVVFTQGVVGNPHYKEFYFFQLDSNGGQVVYQIFSESQDTSSFIQAIKLFIGSVKTSSRYEEFSMIDIGSISLPRMAGVTYRYYVDAFGESSIEIIFEGDEETAQQLLVTHYKDDYISEYSENDRRDVVDGFGWVYEDYEATMVDSINESLVFKIKDDIGSGYIINIFEEQHDGTNSVSFFLYTDNDPLKQQRLSEYIDLIEFKGLTIDYSML